MMNVFRKLLGLCEHKWEIIQRISVYVTWDGERSPGQLPDHQKIVLQCQKCGDVKKVKV